MEQEKFIVECPTCRKKFRINKKIRFQCKYCSTLISPEWDENITVTSQESQHSISFVSLPPQLRGTQEQLLGTTQKRKQQRFGLFFSAPKNLSKRLAYWYDNFISQGPFAMFLTLVGMFVVTWTLCMGIYLILGSGTELRHQMWITLLQLCDPGSIAEASEQNKITKGIAFFTGMLGVLIFSLLIAFLTNFFDQKFQELKKGHSIVIEDGHTLILGWSEKIPAIISELIVAHEHNKNTIVILSSHLKEEVEEYLHNAIKHRGRTKIIVRYGEISNIHDLEKVAISQSQSIILLNESSKHPDHKEIALADTHVIKAILSICKNPARRPEAFHIVTELNAPDNISIARSIGEDEITIFHPNEIIAKILVQTSRQSGLATIYNEILAFSGNELYCVNEPKTYNKTLGNILYDFPKAIPLGVKAKDRPAQLNPPMNTIIRPGDEVILIARDETELNCVPSSRLPSSLKIQNLFGRREPQPERELILGWNSKIENIISEYGNYLCQDSQIDVLVPKINQDMKDLIQNLQQKYLKIKVRLLQCDYRIRNELQEITPFSYHTIIVLASELGEQASLEEIDSQTIYTLLLLRDMQTKVKGTCETKIITELLDSANQELIQIAHVDDFVISNQLISMILAQVSQQKSLYEVYADLFNAEGSEIYLKSTKLYFEKFPVDISFFDIMAIVSQRKEIAFGYRIQRWSQRPDLNFGIYLNPDKSQKVWLEETDQIIVVAEDDL